jgi:AcrR family transcriptional regulator
VRKAPTTSTSTPEADDSVESRILDAALVQFEKQGFKKTTIEDIARQASVDRVTIYRRIGSRDDVVSAVNTREVQRVLTQLGDLADRIDNADELVVGMFAAVLSSWRTHPFAQHMLTVEPERVIGALTVDGATPFTLTVAAMGAILQGAMVRGVFPELPDLFARVEIICRIVHSIILQPAGSIRLESEEDIEAFARQYLIPILIPAGVVSN